MTKPNKSDMAKNILYAFSLVGILGFEIAVPIVLGIMLGIYLDRRYNTGGIFTVVCALLSVLVGAYNFYRLLAKVTRWK